MNLIYTQYKKMVDLSHVNAVFRLQRISTGMQSIFYLMAELDTMELVCIGAFTNADAADHMKMEIHDWSCDDNEDSVFAVSEMAKYMSIALVSQQKGA